MPVSYHEPYERYKQWVTEHHPKTVLDVGMGYGNIGKYAKQIYPDIELNGVEVFVPYLVHETEYERYKYSLKQEEPPESIVIPSYVSSKMFKRMIVADIRDMIGKLWPVDMIVAFDVIEHLEREDGIRVIKYLTSIANMGLLVTVPIINYPQGSLHGNDAEIHRTQWKFEEMIELGANPLLKGKVVGLFEFKKA